LKEIHSTAPVSVDHQLASSVVDYQLIVGGAEVKLLLERRRGFGMVTECFALCKQEADLPLAALTLLVGWQEGHPACEKIECFGAGSGICLGYGADLHMAQLMPLPLSLPPLNPGMTNFQGHSFKTSVTHPLPSIIYSPST